MTTDRTLFLLLAEFGTGQIPVEKCAHHFGMKAGEARGSAAAATDSDLSARLPEIPLAGVRRGLGRAH